MPTPDDKLHFYSEDTWRAPGLAWYLNSTWLPVLRIFTHFG